MPLSPELSRWRKAQRETLLAQRIAVDLIATQDAWCPQDAWYPVSAQGLERREPAVAATRLAQGLAGAATT